MECEGAAAGSRLGPAVVPSRTAASSAQHRNKLLRLDPDTAPAPAPPAAPLSGQPVPVHAQVHAAATGHPASTALLLAYVDARSAAVRAEGAAHSDRATADLARRLDRIEALLHAQPPPPAQPAAQPPQPPLSPPVALAAAARAGRARQRLVFEPAQPPSSPSPSSTAAHPAGTAELVVVNVGGTVFTTRATTLRRVKGSFLDAMFSGRHRVSRTAGGAVFVDRDPKYFAPILSWLRDPAAPLQLPVDDPAFLHELEYFGLREAMLSHRSEPQSRFVYVVGGWDGSVVYDAVERLDTTTGVWESLPVLPTPRHWCGCALVDNHIYVCGGEDDTNGVASVLRCSLTTLAWEAAMPMSFVRCDMGCTVLNGKIYVVGGYGSSGAIMASAECYDPQTDSWSAIQPMHAPRERVRCCALNGKIYALGGHDGHAALDSVERYDPKTDSWTVCAAMKVARAAAMCATIQGKLYVFGGSTNEAQHSATVECWDPSTKAWTAVCSMPSPRYRSGIAVSGGTAYIIGGYRNKIHVKTVDRFNPATGEWAELAALGQARSDVSCCVAAF